MLQKSIVSSSTEIWYSTGIYEGERALSMTAHLFVRRSDRPVSKQVWRRVTCFAAFVYTNALETLAETSELG